MKIKLPELSDKKTDRILTCCLYLTIFLAGMLTATAILFFYQ